MTKRETIQISAVLPLDVADRLDRWAKTNLLSRADAIRQLLVQSLHRIEKRGRK
jgi:metal-responsive CopG/Arc/MetJ family transcriptional regulator